MKKCIHEFIKPTIMDYREHYSPVIYIYNLIGKFKGTKEKFICRICGKVKWISKIKRSNETIS